METKISYNQYSEDQKVKPLKGDEVRKFKLVNIRFDKKDGRHIFSGAGTIPNRDLIRDSKGEPIEIAYIERYDVNGNPVLGEIEFRRDMGGEVVCRATPSDYRKLEFMVNTNFNKSNPNRDTRKEALFEEVEPSKTARQLREERELRHLAIQMAREMSDMEVRAYYSGIGLNPDDDLEVIREEVEKRAEQSPMEFQKRAKAQEKLVILEIKEAENAGLIVWSKEENKWSDASSKQTILVIERGANTGKYVTFANWLIQDPKGEKYREEMVLKTKARS